MEFFLFLVSLFGFFALYTRQGKILERINDIERHVRQGMSGVPTSQAAHVQSYGERMEGESTTKNDVSLGSKDSVLATRLSSYEVNHVAPSPAPAPSPDYSNTSAQVAFEVPKTTFADEAQEEKSARWLGRIGGLMVFLGMVFFVNYAIDEGWLGVAGQFMLGILVGLIMIIIGHLLRTKHLGDIAYERFAVGLLGGGIAVLYLIIFAGFSILHYQDGTPVISQTLAFALMILVTATTMVLSVVANSRFLAISAVVGGFLTPIMVSTGENHLVTLSLYIIMLNTSVLGMGWFKKWSWLNFAAMLGTVVLFGGWMERFYFKDAESQLPMTFLFLSIFFIQFLVIAVLHHFRRNEESSVADLCYLTLNSGLYFLASYGILRESYSDYLGFFALILAMIHLCVAYMSYTSDLRDRRLNLFLVGVAVVFLSIAVPLQLSGYWISLSWLIEAVVLISIGVYLRENVLQVFGWIVFVLGMGSVLDDVTELRGGGYFRHIAPDITPFANSAFFMLVMAVLSIYVIGYVYARFKNVGEWKKIVAVMMLAANLLTLFAVTSEIGIKYDKQIRKVQQLQQASLDQARMYQGEALAGYGNMQFREQEYGVRIPENKESERARKEISALENQKSTVQSVFWTLYAILLLVLGFMKRMRALRISGLILIFLTAVKVFFMVWELGAPYSIVASMIFGVLALIASFIYVKYKHLLKEIIYDEKQ